MRKHKFNSPLTVAFTSKMYDAIKKLSDRNEISMAEWLRESLGKIIDKNSDDLEAMVSEKGGDAV